MTVTIPVSCPDCGSFYTKTDGDMQDCHNCGFRWDRADDAISQKDWFDKCDEDHERDFDK